MLFQPFLIGPIPITSPLILAPMAGHTNYALRSLCRDLGGCQLTYTELVSSHVLQYKNQREKALLGWKRDEYPLAVQLFGSDPTEMAEAARMVVDAGASIVDINMGCWVPKVAKKGAGAALLKDVCTATRVVEAVVRSVPVPVTVKVRSGFEDGVVTAIPFAKAAESCGVQAIAVHARFASQGHTGRANWQVIQQVKESVSIPVIGNGDVTTGDDAERMLQETGCDAVMIGRAVLGQPWLFHHIETYLKTGEHLPKLSIAEIAKIALQHMERTKTMDKLGEQQLLFELRGQLSKYQLDKAGSCHIRNQIVRVETFQELERILIQQLN